MTRTTILLMALVALALPGDALSQSLGTFRWQLQPYCNVVTLAITQVGGIYRLEGTDDQCGGGRDLAAVQGLAFPNPDGTIGFGMTIVTAPGGRPVHVDAEIAVATASGTWRDSAGSTGAFALTAGNGTGGSVRPPPTPPAVIPAAVALAPTGSIVASGAVGVGTVPASGEGVRMMWYPGKAAFRAGRVSSGADANAWDEANIGTGSVAFGSGTRAIGGASMATGENTTATGFASTATGSDTKAFGFASTAMGVSTTALGNFSTAMGRNSEASAPHSVAMGVNTRASGDSSTATGSGTTAGGQYSFAGGSGSGAGGTGAMAFGQLVFANGDGSVVLGSNAVAVPGAFGSFVFADRSTSTQLFSLTPNEFVVRADGGVTFFSNAAASTGVTVAPGSGSWSSVSDVHMKEHFRDLNGDDVLARIAHMPVREWNYTTQDASIRHMGPTAQDFRAAFGLGESDVRISTIDADGVALAGVKALEARTRATADRLARENEQLRARLERLEALLAAK